MNKNPDIGKDLSGQKPTESNKHFSDQLKTGISPAGIAHDLNNILTTISGYAEMLQEDLPGGSQITEKVSRILAAVTKARSLTEKMLGTDQQAGFQEVSVDVTAILKETVDLTRPTLPPDVKINIEVPKRKVNVLADPTQLFRVFLNLINNAAQSMEERGGIVGITLRILDSESVKSLINKNKTADEYCDVTFRDTGLGINGSLLQKIFDPYFTARKSGGGTGLGLSVVRDILAVMGGEIIVSSKENEGSVFDVYLPVFKETTE